MYISKFALQKSAWAQTVQYQLKSITTTLFLVFAVLNPAFSANENIENLTPNELNKLNEGKGATVLLNKENILPNEFNINTNVEKTENRLNNIFYSSHGLFQHLSKFLGFHGLVKLGQTNKLNFSIVGPYVTHWSKSTHLSHHARISANELMSGHHLSQLEMLFSQFPNMELVVDFQKELAIPDFFGNDLEKNREIIPNSIDKILIVGDWIKSIGHSFLADCPNLTSVTIGNGVESIGDYFLFNSTCLTSFTIPDSVKEIGAAFCANCYNLTSVIIGDNVEIIYENCFYNCSSLLSVKFPNSIIEIADGAFFQCVSLKSVEFGNRLEYIGNESFLHCFNLASLTLPASVQTVGRSFLYNCQNISSLTIKNKEMTVGERFVCSCPRLVKLILSKNIDTAIKDDKIFEWFKGTRTEMQTEDGNYYVYSAVLPISLLSLSNR